MFPKIRTTVQLEGGGGVSKFWLEFWFLVSSNSQKLIGPPTSEEAYYNIYNKFT